MNNEEAKNHYLSSRLRRWTMALDSSKYKLAIRYENKEIHRCSVCQKPSDDKVRWNLIGVSQWNSTLECFWDQNCVPLVDTAFSTR